MASKVLGRWLGVEHQLKRYLATQASVKEAPGLAYEDAAPYNSIPREGALKVMYRIWKNPELKSKNFLMGEILLKEYGPVCRLGIPGAQEIVFLHEPQDAQTLYNSDGKNPVEPGFDFFVTYRQDLRKDLYPETGGLLGSHGEKWYEVRSKVQQDMMRPTSAFHYIDDVTNISNELLDLFMKKQNSHCTVEDITPFLYRWSLEAVGAIFLDKRLGCLQEPTPAIAAEMVKHVDVCLGEPAHELSNGIPFWKLWRTKDFDLFDTHTEGMHKVLTDTIEEAKEKINATGTKNKRDEMSVLEKLIDKCGPESKIPEVMAMDAMMAGIDTTGNSSAFLLYLLASNPKQQEILYQEIKEKLGDKKLTPKILNELKYLKAVQHESSRLLPAVGGTARITQKDIVCSGYQIPKGSKVVYGFTALMRREEHFDQPEKFMPERWIRGCPEHNKAHPFAFIPFSHGARMCIGRRFAELELQILAIETLRRFKLEYEGPVVDLITPFVNRPDGPVAIKFIKR